MVGVHGGVLTGASREVIYRPVWTRLLEMAEKWDVSGCLLFGPTGKSTRSDLGNVSKNGENDSSPIYRKVWFVFALPGPLPGQTRCSGRGPNWSKVVRMTPFDILFFDILFLAIFSSKHYETLMFGPSIQEKSRFDLFCNQLACYSGSPSV